VVDQAMVTAIARRRDHARVAVRARDRAVLARTCVLTSMVAVMSTAVGTMAWAFLSVPNLP
jgi:ABC-type Fe3+ transport system permease subunit